MTENLKHLAVAVLAIVVTMAVVSSTRYYFASVAWEARADSVQAIVDADAERILQLEAAAHQARLEAATAAAEASTLRELTRAQAGALSALRPVLEGRADSLRIVTPEEIASHPSVVGRDLLIRELGDTNLRWEVAYGDLGKAFDKMEASFFTAEARGDSLALALGIANASIKAYTDLLEGRPGNRPWWKPHVGVGPSVGIQPDGDPYAGFGVHLGWSLPL